MWFDAIDSSAASAFSSQQFVLGYYTPGSSVDTLLVSSKHAYSFLEGNQAFSLNKVSMLYVTCMPVYNLAAILMVLEPRQQVFYK